MRLQGEGTVKGQALRSPPPPSPSTLPSMPFHRIYAPPGLFTAQEKQALATSVTAVYEVRAGVQ